MPPLRTPEEQEAVKVKLLLTDVTKEISMLREYLCKRGYAETNLFVGLFGYFGVCRTLFLLTSPRRIELPSPRRDKHKISVSAQHGHHRSGSALYPAETDGSYTGAEYSLTVLTDSESFEEFSDDEHQDVCCLLCLCVLSL